MHLKIHLQISGSIWLVTVLLPNIARGIYGGDMKQVFLPANALFPNKTIVPKTFYHIYEVERCTFKILFALADCIETTGHTAMLIFFNNFYELLRQIPNGTMPNAIVFSRNPLKFPPNVTTKFPSFPNATYNVLVRGKKENFTEQMINIDRSEVEVRLSKRRAKIQFPEGSDFELKFTHAVRHFALFTSPPESCPTAISKISEGFPIWVPGRPIPVQGRQRRPPPDPTTLRDVVGAVIFIIVYYALLVNFILPPYFDRRFPLVSYYPTDPPIHFYCHSRRWNAEKDFILNDCEENFYLNFQ